MLIEISVGEGLDRLSILDIKQKEITDAGKQIHISKEISSLSELLIYKETYIYYYNLLLYVNKQIWDKTNTIKTMNPQTSEFGVLANTIFELNQSRFRLKQIINQLTECSIQEQKSYGFTSVDIHLTDTEEIDISRMSELSLMYDRVIIHCSTQKRLEFEQCVPLFNYFFVNCV
jgi:hypothetical protein